jgi:hypothetical protein
LVCEERLLGATRIIGEINAVTVRILPDGEAGPRVLLGVIEFPRRFHRGELPQMWWRHTVFRRGQLLPPVGVLTIASKHDMNLLILLSDNLSESVRPIDFMCSVETLLLPRLFPGILFRHNFRRIPEMNISGTPSLVAQLFAHVGGRQLEGFIEVLLQSLLMFGFFELMLCDGVVIAEPKLEVVRSDCFFDII